MFLKVNDDVAGNVPVDPEDTLKVKKALNRIGRYEVPSYGMTKYPDQPMLDGIKQIQRDHGLFRDGLLKPKGPTENAINKELAQNRFSQPEQRQAQSGTLEPWQTDLIAKHGREIERNNADIKRLLKLNARETDPNTKSARSIQIDQLEKRNEFLREEIRQIPNRRSA